MPRAKIETAFLGHYTLAILDECDAPDAGVLIRALAAWILRDELADESDIPAHLRVLWRIIRDESNTIHDARKQLRENGAHGGRPKANQTQPKGNQKETKSEPKGNQKESKIEIEVERENTPANAGDTRAPATVDGLEPSCPLTDEEVTHFAPAGMTPDEIRDWRDYYESREWKIEPNAPRPMTRFAARASLRRWHTMQGVREAREAHIDAKMDERAAKRTAALQGPTPTSYEEIEAAKRRAEAESPVVVGFDENGLAILAKKGN